MSAVVNIVPMVLVPLTFVFVLLIVLIARSPKAGAWVIGGLLLMSPILLLRLAHSGMFLKGAAVPLFLVPLSFLFVLLVILLAKAPKAGAGLIGAIVLMVLIGLFLLPVSYRRAEYVAGSMPQAPIPPIPPSPPSPPSSPAAPAPIWSEGVEQEFDADVYPSSIAAARALGRRMDRSVRELIGDATLPVQIVLFPSTSDPALIAALRNAIQQAMPEATCTVEADIRDLRPGEVGVSITVADSQRQKTPWSQADETRSTDGTISATMAIATGERNTVLQRRFVETPWIDNFAIFASARPQQSFIIARSLETSTSESEANQQALEDARARIAEALGRHADHRHAGLTQSAISTADVLNGGFIVDRFVQSFDTWTGKVWRQALLIDVSGPRLSQLAQQKTSEARSARMSWGRMGFSVIGVFVLIGAIYFFLNMATMGYYEWSLRIAGVILAIVAIVSILMIVQ